MQKYKLSKPAILMKRSEINNIILEANEMIKSFGHHLPDFAYWSVEKFREKQEEAKETFEPVVAGILLITVWVTFKPLGFFYSHCEMES